jgi:predicted metal-dependent enzyme (double-stranded beta helix superfamily)
MKALYESSKALLEGTKELDGPFVEIRDWITGQFQVTPLNVRLRLRNSMLSIVFKNDEDRVQYNEASRRLYEKEATLRSEYLRILGKYPDPPQEMYLHIDHFQNLALQQVFAQADLEAFHLDGLWRIYLMGGQKTVFFFYDERYVEEYQDQVKKAALKGAYHQFLKKTDEFDLLMEEDLVILFDTKEVFEITYQGSMQFYLKDH